MLHDDDDDDDDKHIQTDVYTIGKTVMAVFNIIIIIARRALPP